MKMQSEMEKVSIRTTTFGEGEVKICLPIVAKTQEEIRNQAREAVLYQPDVVEFRADWYEAVENPEELLQTLQMLRTELADTILLFTIRTAKEGGERQFCWEQYVNINETAVMSGLIDMLDVEAFSHCTAQELDAFSAAQLKTYANEEVKQVIARWKQKGVVVVCSNHDFAKTPSVEHMSARLESMQYMGADIAKLAVMPQSAEDVLHLLRATWQVKEKKKTPVITMSMGKLGEISRTCGSLFGNAMTFACAAKASAPGQIPVNELRHFLKLQEV